MRTRKQMMPTCNGSGGQFMHLWVSCPPLLKPEQYSGNTGVIPKQIGNVLQNRPTVRWTGPVQTNSAQIELNATHRNRSSIHRVRVSTDPTTCLHRGQATATGSSPRWNREWSLRQRSRHLHTTANQCTDRTQCDTSEPIEYSSRACVH